jgi:4-amino-4-deoxy-L-arabinose transferase-like glycosyltransferase
MSELALLSKPVLMRRLALAAIAGEDGRFGRFSGATGRLVLAGVWVGLAFQAKMTEAWMVLPAMGLAYLLAGPGPAARRAGQLVIAGVVAGLVSVSWMTAVSLVPAADRVPGWLVPAIIAVAAAAIAISVWSLPIGGLTGTIPSPTLVSCRPTSAPAGSTWSGSPPIPTPG